jgi:type II secretory pathway component PulK
MKREGFALIAALWLVVMLASVGLDAALRSRPQRLAAANQLDIARAREAALAGAEYARSRLTAALLVGQEEMRRNIEEQARRSGGRATTSSSGRITISGGSVNITRPSFNEDAWYDPQGLMPPGMQLGDATFTLDTRDTGVFANINELTEDELRNFLSIGLRLDYALADNLTQHILDWRDADDLPRINGGEREEYIKANMPVIPANRPFSSTDELRHVLFMTPEVFAQMRPFITVVGNGRINVNSAGEEVLMTLPGITPAVAQQLVRMRSTGRYPRNVGEIRAVVGNAFRTPTGREQTLFNRRATFQTTEIEIVSTGGVQDSPLQVTVRTLIVRTNNSAIIGWRRFE